MFVQTGKMMGVVSVLMLMCGVGVAFGDCPYKDEWGEPTMHMGGAALGDLFGQMDPDGTRFGIPSDYEEWDLNEDGILDKLQFALLTEILCASPNTPHPTINFSEVHATFADNLDLYWHMVYSIKDAEAAMIAGAPDILAASNALRDAAADAGMLDDVLTPDVFGGNLPPEWDGYTWETLFDVMKESAEGIIWMEGQGYIGDGSVIWLILENVATAHVMAAMWGLDSDFTATFFELEHFVLLEQFLSLTLVDWGYVMTVFDSVDAGLITDNADAIADINLGSDVLPDQEMLGITSNGEDALHADVMWGDTTLSDLVNQTGGDIEALWEEILTQLPGVPVGTAPALLLLAGAVGLVGAAKLRRK